MFEGCFIGFGWGVFDVAVPAFATQEEVPTSRCMDLCSLWYCYSIGGLLGGLVSKKLAPLSLCVVLTFFGRLPAFQLHSLIQIGAMALVGASSDS
jgi:hypothetical protein